MAISSSWKYHVFLSFRGEDTRTSFTDHLHAALKRKGVITFKDNKDLERGQVISHQLIQAIQESLSSIVVLSQNYASSSWCLDELQKILESRKELGMEVFPVFYDIDPCDVRHQKGSFADAFRNLEERFGEDKLQKVQRWREALTQVANISGFHSKGRLETKLIEEIVGEVWEKIQLKLPFYNNGLVGIDSRMEGLNKILKTESNEIRLIGICGMGGIGKTTLARTMYERICGLFDTSCFLTDVRDESKDSVGLQRKLLSDLSSSDMKIKDLYEGRKQIRNFLCGKKVLLVFDDVSELNQLENLLMADCLGAGSRVIVTTRDMHLLTSHGDFEIYGAKLLSYDESLQLFCKRAFKRDKPNGGYLELSKSVIELAGGLPLTLQTLGSYLCGRSVLEWQIALEKIKKYPPKDILNRLGISYEVLDDMEKNIFLDIACFFKGMAKDRVVDMLEICGLYPVLGIKQLMEKSLLIEYYNHGTWRLGMHDILQEMGKRIVFQESPSDAGKRSRLWSQEDIDNVLTNNKGSESIEVIFLKSSKPYEAWWDPSAFSNMCNLRILVISCDLHISLGLKCLPKRLKILEWNKCPLKFLPLQDHQNELVDLKLHYSKLIQLWKGTQISEKLRFIDLSHSTDLVETPKFSTVPNLERLVLEGCIKLVEVHRSLGQHKKLLVVNLKDCKNLKLLPRKLEMDSLCNLILSGCSKVKKLSEFGENMKCLSTLDLKNCTNLTCLPSSIRNLKSLKILSMLGCEKFHSLPENLDENKCLEELDVSGTAISEIPSSVIGLKNLKVLFLNGCKGSSSRSNSRWNNSIFPFQKEFSSQGVPRKMTLTLPPSLSGLSSLKELDLSYCNLNVASIPHDLHCLQSLEVLDISGNNFGSSILSHSFSHLPSLRTLGLSNCNLCDDSIPIQLIPFLSRLSILRLSGNSFTKIPLGCVSNLLPLRVLILSPFQRLQSFSDLPPNAQSHADLHLWNFIASTYFQVSFPHSLSLDTQFVIWSTTGNQIPSWFHNQNFLSIEEIFGFRDKHIVRVLGLSFLENNNNDGAAFWTADSIVSMKVDVSHFCGSSNSWGICMCLVVQEMTPANSEHPFDRVVWLTSKATEDEFFQDEIGWVMPAKCDFPRILIMFFPCNDVRAGGNQIELIVYTSRYSKKDEGEAKANIETHGKAMINKCGWRVTWKEDVQEWRRTSENNRLILHKNEEN